MSANASANDPALTPGSNDLSQDLSGYLRVRLPGGTSSSSFAPAATGVAANAPNNATTTAYVSGAVVKASAGTLYGFSGYNSKASGQFILFYDSAAVPADTAQAVLVIAVPASGNFSYNPGIYGRKFLTGISWSNSSTAPTKTVGSADCFVDAQVV